jgi:hypothetical protein
MIPKSVANKLTNEERLLIRRWKYGVAIIYGAAALWLVGLSIVIVTKNPVEAPSSPGGCHASCQHRCLLLGMSDPADTRFPRASWTK